MTTSVPLPTGSYVNRDPQSSCKRLVNCFSETNGTTSELDSKSKRPPITIRRWAGTSTFTDTGLTGSNNAVRGLHKMGLIEYAVIGSGLYSISSTGVPTLIANGIGGNGFVRMQDNTACLFILLPGSSTAYTYCPNGGGFAKFLDSTFLQFGAVDIAFIDSFFVFLTLDGRSFYNDDGQGVSGQGPPTFTTGAVFPREFATDRFVGFCADHREAFFLGQLTAEGYLNVGNATGSPFASAPDTFMHIGAHPLTPYAIAIQDQSPFWIAQDLTVRRRNGETPSRVSNSGIEAILEKANLTGCYALTPSIAGHPLWVLVMPAEQRTIAFDCLTTEWFELESSGLGYWRALCWDTFQGKQLVGDSQNGRIGYLDTTVYSEFGAFMRSAFTTQSVYDGHNRIVHRRLELVVTVGGTSSPSFNPKVTLYVSDDGGKTFYAREDKVLGFAGQYTARCVWFNLGMSRNRVYMFQISDAAPAYTVDVTVELSGGKW